MPLNEMKLRALRTNPVAGKHGDADGLFLRIDPQHRMYWQWRIRTAKGESTVSYGRYPDVGLAEARARHKQAREQKRLGIDLNKAKRDAKHLQAVSLTNSFEEVTREWFATRKDEWSASYGDKIIRRMEVDMFPYIGKTPVADIGPNDLLTVLRRIEKRGVIETAHRALENCGQVLRYAVATGRIPSDPSRDLKGALKKPNVKHMAAITDLGQLAVLLRTLDGYVGTPIVRAALAISPILMLRPGELRFAQWEEFDLDNATWTIPAVRMKREKEGKLNGNPHIVPLPKQVVVVLRDLHHQTGPKGYVFPGQRDHERPMSENTVNAALRRMDYDTQKDITGHGFRATARTILDEHIGIDRAVIEAQLAHSVTDSLGRAYNRTEFLVQRRNMLQVWADYLDDLRTKFMHRESLTGMATIASNSGSMAMKA